MLWASLILCNHNTSRQLLSNLAERLKTLEYPKTVRLAVARQNTSIQTAFP